MADLEAQLEQSQAAQVPPGPAVAQPQPPQQFAQTYDQSFEQHTWQFRPRNSGDVFHGTPSPVRIQPHHVVAAQWAGSLSLTSVEPMVDGHMYTQTIAVLGKGSVRVGLIGSEQIEHMLHSPQSRTYIPKSSSAGHPSYVGVGQSRWSEIDQDKVATVVEINAGETPTTICLSINMFDAASVGSRTAELRANSDHFRLVKQWRDLPGRVYMFVECKRDSKREVVLMPCSVLTPSALN